MNLYITIFVLCLGFTSAFASQLDFLENYSRTSLLLNQINFETVKDLKSCTCYLIQRSNLANKNCKDSEHSKEPTFIRRGINLYGEQIKKSFTCEKIVETMIIKKIKENYEPMRRAMVAMDSERKILGPSLYGLTEQFNLQYAPDVQGIEYKINRKPIHLVNQLVYLNMPLKQPRKVNQTETIEALKDFKMFGYKSCMEILSKKRSNLISKLGPEDQKIFADSSDWTICYNIIDSLKGSNYATSRLPELVGEMFKMRETIYRKKNREKYVELIQKNPLLLLVSDDTPSLSEIADALSFVLKNAKKRLDESTQTHRERSFIDSLKFTNAGPYAKAIWKGQGEDENKFDTLFAENLEAYHSDQKYKQYGETAAIIALTAACILPWGKALSAGMMLLKTSCLAGLGIPANAYFLVDSFEGYQESVQHFFSYVDRGQAIDDMIDEIENERNGLLISAILFPLSLELGNIKKIPELLRKAKITF